ncbi:MAG TPA: serine/threonine-protein kinase [Chthoniobacterales bacterium]|jgi:serine/threonine protein kinase|nr:serine/threonine-protein kinase [Chthoniobacterales bacterium]
MDPLDSLAAEFCSANDLTFVGFVGAGAFKRAYHVTTGSGVALALKIVDPATSSVDRTVREIEALQQCRSPRLSRYHSSGTIPFGDTSATYLIEEFFTEGTLSDMLSKGELLCAGTIITFARALGEALAELSTLRLVHRDIKPDNIMFRKDDPIPVLTDFGLVRNLGRSSLTPSWQPQGPGTPMFSSPEQLNNEKILIGWRTDQFALGLVLGFSFTGRHPFRANGMSDYDAICAVADRKQPSREFVEAAKANDLHQLITMLHPWPAGRFPTPEKLLTALQ